MAELKLTDALPTGFTGETLKREDAQAHWLSFEDYLITHGLDNPADAAAVNVIVNRFKLTLSKTARLWINGKNFANLDALQTAFVTRFSAQHSHFANVKLFDDMRYTPGEAAELYLNRIRLAAAPIGYGDDIIKNKFMATLPDACKANVLMSVADDATPDQVARLAQKCMDAVPEVQREVSFSATVDSDNRPTATLDVARELTSIRDELHSLRLDNDAKSRGRNRYRSPNHRGDSHSHTRSRDRHRSISRNRPSERSHSRGRYRSNSRSRSRRVIFCDYCKYPGHKWRNCRKRHADMQRSEHTGMQDNHVQHF